MSDTVELLVGGVIAAAVVGTTIGLVWDELAARFRFWPWRSKEPTRPAQAAPPRRHVAAV